MWKSENTCVGCGFRLQRSPWQQQKESWRWCIQIFLQSHEKMRAQDGKFIIGLQSQETIHHESSFYFIIQLNLIELRTEGVWQDGNQTINVQLRRFWMVTTNNSHQKGYSSNPWEPNKRRQRNSTADRIRKQHVNWVTISDHLAIFVILS